MAKDIKNLAASVKERLRNYSSQSGKEFQSVFRQFIQERFLYRLSKSKFADNLILKGALLFVAHDISRSRPTKDIDFLGSAISNKKDKIAEIVKDILKIECNDGLRFDISEINTEYIDDDGDYKGVRVKFNCYLENSRERVQLDIGFGDKITSGPIDIDFPTMLDFPAPRIKVYSIESAIAEKFEAIVSLQLQTSRMKDFYDIYFFAENYNFKKDLLKDALLTTFNHRSTEIELRKEIFEDKFKTDEQLQKFWLAFIERSKLSTEKSFAKIVNKIHLFIEPVFSDTQTNNWNNKEWKWI